MNWSYLDNVNYYSRYGHSADLIGNSIYLFGGYSGGRKNDLHQYDLDNKTLQSVLTTGKIPSARSHHGSAVIQQNLYIFGGDGNSAVRKDHTLYSLNTNTKEWTTIPNKTNAFPSSRYDMSMFSFENSLYVFGGYSHTTYTTCKDFYEFNLQTKRWSEVCED